MRLTIPVQEPRGDSSPDCFDDYLDPFDPFATNENSRAATFSPAVCFMCGAPGPDPFYAEFPQFVPDPWPSNRSGNGYAHQFCMDCESISHSEFYCGDPTLI